MNARDRLGVVIVSFNTRDLLARCLASLDAEIRRAGLTGRSQVWVVDNASGDGSAEMVKTQYPAIHLDALTTNLGFAAANNRLLAPWCADPEGCPDWVLVLNPDTELQPGALETLIGALEADPGAAMAGPALVYPDAGMQHSAFRFPGLVQMVLDLFPVDRLMDSRLNGRYPQAAYRQGQPFDVDFALGACLLVRGRALAKVGAMDDGFFLYSEEVDWAKRFHTAGFRVICVPRAVVVHHAGASTQQFRAASLTRLWQSRLHYFAKHEPAWRRAMLGLAIRLGFGLRRRADQLAARRGTLSADEVKQRSQAYDAIFVRT